MNVINSSTSNYIYIYSGASVIFHQYFNKSLNTVSKIKSISILHCIQYQNTNCLFQKNISVSCVEINYIFKQEKRKTINLKDRIKNFLLCINLEYHKNYILTAYFTDFFFLNYRYLYRKRNDLHLAPLYIYVCEYILIYICNFLLAYYSRKSWLEKSTLFDSTKTYTSNYYSNNIIQKQN